MKLSQIAHILNAKFKGKDGDFESISTDTRTIQPGSLFIALQGPHFDAHNFIDTAVERGAMGAIVSRWIAISLPQIYVNDTHAALIQLGSHQRDQMREVIVIAVTGSCGKTTTRALLASVFRQQGNVLASERSFNNNIGLPLTLMRLRAEHDYAVVELGANHLAEIAQLAQIAKSNIAIITNAGPAHLEGFGSIEGVAKAKSEIYQRLSPNGIAIVNNDDPFRDFWREIIGVRRTITFACNNRADVAAKNISVNPKGQSRFRLILPNGEVDVQLSLLGKHNVMNALAAAAAAYAEQLPIMTIKAGLEAASAVSGRLASLKGYRGATIIDDSYNANPLSVSAAIDVLATCGSRSILVLGDMRELGEGGDQLHRKMGEQALQSGIHELFCYGSLTRHTVEAFGKNAYHFDDQEKLLRALKNNLDENTVVLLKGSLYMNMGKIVKGLIEE
ncbi:UDP-N-acetylmuramoyl-tripeptide--D-alanyl-D-alanine ligase [Coxiella-like endosymbiont of Rhipicephalus sanguineus]|uniref:UDP-N-acetylmuramoyl-tripeptide--D-alanyl-D- alanine ligase n=1 Tax=Coxiella-like endosymbiont of Rhipicephalus sanguineus TaxID=1955402 RepID=UPI0020413087|nr:UDP-N-acetylmuramoyl-tripeptide--D-alanyl-D-alanine ligase [Coxiella-like endosymbiont of Rhipicephalus sanguineus]MBT8506653.1 UDP-N-acetylmuramoyl-tripeptide--D-alanyl-D-alanine ligase [Coxiella-like endosymbiont of Rhipicephalus sanguineus]